MSRLARLAETGRKLIPLHIGGAPVTALEGDMRC
jgi:hypothetical protein